MVLEEVKIEELNKIFDANSKKVLNYLLLKTLISYPEFLPTQSNTALYLEKKQCEQWIVQALGLKPVGEGSYPIDGIRGEDGFDVSSLSLGQTSKTKKMKSQTGEKSLGQKFDDENFGEIDDTLDQLFILQKGDKIVEAWRKILEKKWGETIKENNLTTLYLVNLVLYKPESKLYLFLLKINYDALDQINSGAFSKKGSSVDIGNMISSDFGSIKIYKAKKRMELRINPKIFLKNKSFLSFDLKRNVNKKDLRKMFSNPKELESYCEQEIKKYKDFFENLKK